MIKFLFGDDEICCWSFCSNEISWNRYQLSVSDRRNFSIRFWLITQFESYFVATKLIRDFPITSWITRVALFGRCFIWLLSEPKLSVTKMKYFQFATHVYDLLRFNFMRGGKNFHFYRPNKYFLTSLSLSRPDNSTQESWGNLHFNKESFSFYVERAGTFQGFSLLKCHQQKNFILWARTFLARLKTERKVFGSRMLLNVRNLRLGQPTFAWNIRKISILNLSQFIAVKSSLQMTHEERRVLRKIYSF